MSFARLELLPPGVLEIPLSQLTYDELARANVVCTTLSEGVQLVVSSLARRFGLSGHRLGTGWLRQMDLGARNALVAVDDNNGLIVDKDGACFSFGREAEAEEDDDSDDDDFELAGLGRQVSEGAGRRELGTPQRV